MRMLAVYPIILTVCAMIPARAALAECGLVDDNGRFVEELLRADPEKRFDALLDNPEKHRLQILIGEIVENPDDDTRCLRQYGYRLGAEYFYPGSSVKTIGAIGSFLVLQEKAKEDKRWKRVTPDTDLTIEPHSIYWPEGSNEIHEVSSGTVEDNTDLEDILRQTLVVSSNGAFNRLVDIAGQKRLNQLMWDAGLKSTRLRHRLSMQGLAPLAHETVPRVVFHTKKGDLMLHGIEHTPANLPKTDMSGLDIGAAYIDEATGKRIETPMNFGHKNAISVLDLHRMLVDIVDPKLSGKKPIFALNNKNRGVLRSIMSESAWPTEKKTAAERDARYKPLIPGVLAAGFKREDILYISKAGRAFGFHVANAYIEHPESGRAFFVAAAIYANDSHDTMNDDKYLYESITYPFMRHLGEATTRHFFQVPPAKPIEP